MIKVLAFPDTMYDNVFGTDVLEPTVPAPFGGWGIPTRDRMKDYFCFGVPEESITPELQAWLDAHPQVLCEVLGDST